MDDLVDQPIKVCLLILAMDPKQADKAVTYGPDLFLINPDCGPADPLNNCAHPLYLLKNYPITIPAKRRGCQLTCRRNIGKAMNNPDERDKCLSPIIFLQKTRK